MAARPFDTVPPLAAARFRVALLLPRTAAAAPPPRAPARRARARVALARVHVHHMLIFAGAQQVGNIM